MAQLRFGSAGVTATEIDLSGPVVQQPVGVPAGVIGTSLKGQAFVPVTVAVFSDFTAKFGPTDGIKFGPLAASEWLRNAQALTYLKVLGVGDGTARMGSPSNAVIKVNAQTGLPQGAGDVNEAGFTVGENEPDAADGTLNVNPYANLGGPAGRTYFLGCFMSESNSTVLSQAGLQVAGQNVAVPIVRGVIMAASGVVLTLSSAVAPSVVPASSLVATNGIANGSALGDAVLLQGGLAKQDFVLLLNGLQGINPLYPNVITASFDLTSPNYFPNVLNTDPYNIEQAGHYVYAFWELHPSTAAITGSGVVAGAFGAGSAVAPAAGKERISFLLTGSSQRDNVTGSAAQYVPDYEDFRDRFSAAQSPWVVSQPFGGKPHNLFRIHALDDGTGVSTLYKLSIENLALSTDSSDLYGTFDLVVRQWTDNDSAPVYLEQWRGLSLNPGDDQYIAKIIGDQDAYFDFDRGPTAQKVVVNGNYPNASNYIFIEVDPSVDAAEVDPSALPVGLRGVAHLVTSGSAPLASPPQIMTSGSFSGGAFTGSLPYAWGNVVEAPLPMRSNLTQGTGAKQQVNPLLYWGIQFEHITNPATPNLSTQHNFSLDAFATYFPSHRTDVQDFAVGNNAGTPSNVQNGVIDSDLFNLNGFSLMNVLVVTSSAGTADPNQWVNATYVRNGNITANDASKTRGLQPTDFIQANRRFLKWSFMMQGGFDGVNIFDPDESTLDNAAVEADINAANRNFNNGATVSAYNVALNIMGEVTNTDLQLLAIPGIRNPVVTDAAISAVESRFDALYIMDIEQLDSNGETVASDDQMPNVSLTAENFAARSMNTSFGAAYFPDVVMPDPTTNTNVIVPPSVAVLGALALNDAVGHPWFAPAGFTRGALQTTLEARVQLSKANMDVLYDVNINPLVAFPGNAQGGTGPKGGVVVWGQKTLQQAATALDRVNVRRLLIEIRRQVRDISMGILFEPNRDVTLAKFSAAVTPVLQRIQALAGLTRFKVVIDSSTTTQLDIQNNTIRGKIFVQPTKSIEYVSLDFVVTNNLSQQM
jgi:phage tail sheath protein FI